MLLLLKELTDRFIEFVLGQVKGDTREEKLTSALKSCVSLVTIISFLTIWLLVNHINLMITARDMENGLNRVNELFDTESNNSLSVFVEVNQKLTAQLEENRTERVLFLNTLGKLSEENKWLRMTLVKTLDDGETLKEEYKTLLNACVPNIKENSDTN